MTSVTYPALSGTITASELDTNFSDVVSIASSIGNEQLAGGITADKITDRYALSHETICLIPAVLYNNATDTVVTMTTSNTIAFGGANNKALILQWQPIMKSGMEAYLTSISVQAAEVANSPEVNFYLNGDSSGGSLIGGTGIALAASATIYSLAQTDPVANPLIPMTNGDYISIYLVDSGGGSRSACRGVYVTFGMKYVLQA